MEAEKERYREKEPKRDTIIAQPQQLIKPSETITEYAEQRTNDYEQAHRVRDRERAALSSSNFT